MNAFKFSLQALLTLRERQEQAALQAYAQTLAEQERAASRLDAARCDWTEARGQLQERLQAGCPAHDLVQLQSWIHALELRVRELDHAANSARNQARLAFSRLLAARHATAVLLKLQEEQRRRHHRQRRRHEQRFLDDLASRQNALALLVNPPHPSLWN